MRPPLARRVSRDGGRCPVGFTSTLILVSNGQPVNFTKIHGISVGIFPIENGNILHYGDTAMRDYPMELFFILWGFID